MTREERKELKFKKKTEEFLGLVDKLEVVDVDHKEIMINTIRFKLDEGLEPEQHTQLARSIRGAMFAYIRHELVLNYQEALKLLNYHPERDELYLLLKKKTNELIDQRYNGIKADKATALVLLQKYENQRGQTK